MAGRKLLAGSRLHEIERPCGRGQEFFALLLVRVVGAGDGFEGDVGPVSLLFELGHFAVEAEERRRGELHFFSAKDKGGRRLDALHEPQVVVFLGGAVFVDVRACGEDHGKGEFGFEKGLGKSALDEAHGRADRLVKCGVVFGDEPLVGKEGRRDGDDAGKRFRALAGEVDRLDRSETMADEQYLLAAARTEKVTPRAEIADAVFYGFEGGADASIAIIGNVVMAAGVGENGGVSALDEELGERFEHRRTIKVAADAMKHDRAGR